MSVTIPTAVICPCGWSGTIGSTYDCPACGRDYQNRITKYRAELLQAIARGESPRMLPLTRAWLVRQKLIAQVGAAPAPAAKHGGRRAGRRFALTDLGRLVEEMTRSRSAA